MDHIISILSAISVSITLLSILWVYRHCRRIDTFFGLFAVMFFAFSIWHFFCIMEPMQSVMVSTFIIISALMNVMYMHFLQVKFKINRRNYITRLVGTKENRKVETHQ